MSRKAIVLALMVLFTGMVMATGFSVSPGSYSFDLVAGDNVSKNFSVTWSGSTSVVAEPSAVVVGEDTSSEGVGAVFSPERFILDPGETRSFRQTVVTDLGLVPDNFTVSTRVSTEYLVEYRDSGDGGGSGGSTIVVDDTDNETVNETVVVRNVTKGHLNNSQEIDLLDRVNSLENKTGNQSEVISDLKDDLSSSESRFESLQDVNNGLELLLVLVGVLFTGLVFTGLGGVSKVRSWYESLYK